MANLIEELSSQARKLSAADRVRLAELAWEVQYYAKISPQLGERFATVVERAIEKSGPRSVKR